MNPDRQFTAVAKQEVLSCAARYPEYHADLVKQLIQVVTKQAEGLSDTMRRRDVTVIVENFARVVITKIPQE